MTPGWLSADVKFQPTLRGIVSHPLLGPLTPHAWWLYGKLMGMEVPLFGVPDVFLDSNLEISSLPRVSWLIRQVWGLGLLIESFFFLGGGGWDEFYHGHDTLHTGHLVATKMYGPSCFTFWFFWGDFATTSFFHSWPVDHPNRGHVSPLKRSRKKHQ